MVSNKKLLSGYADLITDKSTRLPGVGLDMRIKSKKKRKKK